MTAVSAATPRFAQFMATMSDEPGKTQIVQTTVNGFAKHVAAMGHHAAQFVKDVGGNLFKGAATNVIASLIVAGAIMAVAPAVPAGGALLAGSFAAKASQTVVEAVVDTVLDNSLKAAGSISVHKAAPARK